MTRDPNADAERTLRTFFASSLDKAEDAEEPVGFDEIAAYVDGQLDDVDREIFESRLALDPALRAEVDDLAAMRAAMAQPQPASSRSRATSMFWMLGALAAAASLTIAVVWVARTRLQQSSMVSEQTSARQTTAPPPTAFRISVQDGGGTIGIDAAGTLTAANLSVSADQQQDAIAALQHGTLPPTALPQELRSPGPLTLMGDPHPQATFSVIAPVATMVREARPTFRWHALPRARAYRVAIFTDRLEPVTASGEMTATTWTPAVDLKPGTTYQWQVTALTPDGPTRTPAPPQPEARFRVLDAEQRQALDRQLAEAGSSNLLRGLAFTRAGVLDEADAAFSALAAANPASPIPRDLLANARRARVQRDQRKSSK